MEDLPDPTLHIRILFDPARFIGPGKADLLENIAASGSIAAAARGMGMSYKRAWTLTETLNVMFDLPLVDAARGGPGKGGAALTDRGKAVLAAYRAVQHAAQAGSGEPLRALHSWARKGD